MKKVISTSKPRYDWWTYVKGMIRRYPELKERYEDLHTPAMTAAYGERIWGRGPSRTTEALAVRELPYTSQREYETVRRAIESTERMRAGTQRLRVIKLTMWAGTHSLQGAALTIPCSYDTAKIYRAEFIKLVAKHYGLMDEEK